MGEKRTEGYMYVIVSNATIVFFQLKMDDPQPCSSNTGESEDTGVPSELKETLAQFDASLSNVEKTIQPWLDVPESELNEEVYV